MIEHRFTSLQFGVLYTEVKAARRGGNVFLRASVFIIYYAFNLGGSAGFFVGVCVLAVSFVSETAREEYGTPFRHQNGHIDTQIPLHVSLGRSLVCFDWSSPSNLLS